MHLQQKFYDLHAPEREIAIDESMVPFKGRVIFKQHMTQKPVKFRIKLWMLCESETGYCSNFDVYLGKEAGADNGVIGKTETVVTQLYVDNFHIGVPLFFKLSDIGIQACGTVRMNRKFYSSELVQEAKQLNRGQFTWKTFDTLVAMVWKDSKPVYFLSSIHNPVEGEPVTRNMEGQQQPTHNFSISISIHLFRKYSNIQFFTFTIFKVIKDDYIRAAQELLWLLLNW